MLLINPPVISGLSEGYRLHNCSQPTFEESKDRMKMHFWMKALNGHVCVCVCIYVYIFDRWQENVMSVRIQ